MSIKVLCIISKKTFLKTNYDKFWPTAHVSEGLSLGSGQRKKM